MLFLSVVSHLPLQQQVQAQKQIRLEQSILRHAEVGRQFQLEQLTPQRLQVLAQHQRGESTDADWGEESAFLRRAGFGLIGTVMLEEVLS